MVFRFGGLSRRDALLLLIGASSMQLWSFLFSQQTIMIEAQPQMSSIDHITTQLQTVTQTITTAVATETPSVDPLNSDTSVLAHAPGWTLFRNLYMSNGTLYLVADELQRSNFPELRKMASHPLPAVNTPENIAAREPSDFDITFITPDEAQTRWGDRILSVEGNTVSQISIIHQFDRLISFVHLDPIQ